MVITSLAESKNVDELHHFLGPSSNYRRPVPLFTNIAKPLNKLLRKDTKFQWSLQCQSAFKHLKNAFCTESILHYPSIYKPYTLFTDASNYAHSGILTQAVYGLDDLRPMAYTSGTFSDSQQRLFATNKEAFAVYQSILKFDIYLRGAQCILHCDDKPLEPFLSCDMKISKLNHWSMELSDYSLNFCSYQGK